MGQHVRQPAHLLSRLLLVLTCWPLAATIVCATALPGAAALAAEPKPLVSLVVDYADGVAVHFTELKWREGMTVLDALQSAAGYKHGITFTHRGSGSSAFVTKIGDLANERDGRNWIYTINGKIADEGAGVRQLKAGAAVLWKFKVYEYNP